MDKKQEYLINNSSPLILDNIPDQVKPGWACSILSLFDVYIDTLPDPVRELYTIIPDIEQWRFAYEIYQKLKDFSTLNTDFAPNTYLLLAELTAQITYNNSGHSYASAFDKNNELDFPYLAINTANYFEDKTLIEETESLLLLFNRSKGLKNTLKTSQDFILFKKINDILWINWHSNFEGIINGNNKFQNYIPDIFILKKTGADITSITNRIYQIERDILNLPENLEYCTLLAEAILAIK
ncbi:hypothetical protein [Apibacter sp. HY039]|uniref:hypothetical protein n=1 Tax=Apibacter sp. HY039 TaxID=2501476 RepID=UPI000FEBA1F2|nr:hypothetical protein [Apibacter sp. HY039]